MKKLAIFDIDFTLTKRETMIEFYKYAILKKPSVIKHLPLALIKGILYILKIIDLKQAKESFASYIEEFSYDELDRLAKGFYKDRFIDLLYKDAVAEMKKLKSEGCLVYLISASPEFYLKELYAIPEVDKIIGTRYVRGDRGFKRYIDGENCKGQQKVKRLKEELNRENIEVDFANSYMYSDSLSDLPLLELVGNPFLINYKKEYKDIKVLKWK